MAKLQAVTHRFVEHMPPSLEEGVVYVSIAFGTVAHKCCCGCGDRVVTPLTPVDWSLVYNGQSVSLHPSIGRWDAACRSHYWIRNNRVVWSGPMSKAQVGKLKGREEAFRDDFFDAQGRLPQRGESGTQGPGSHQSGWIA